jgi:hypothetical protein
MLVLNNQVSKRKALLELKQVILQQAFVGKLAARAQAAVQEAAA